MCLCNETPHRLTHGIHSDSYQLVQGCSHNCFLFFERAIFIRPSSIFFGPLGSPSTGSTSLDPQLQNRNKCIAHLSSLYTCGAKPSIKILKVWGLLREKNGILLYKLLHAISDLSR